MKERIQILLDDAMQELTIAILEDYKHDMMIDCAAPDWCSTCVEVAERKAYLEGKVSAYRLILEELNQAS